MRAELTAEGKTWETKDCRGWYEGGAERDKRKRREGERGKRQKSYVRRGTRSDGKYDQAGMKDTDRPGCITEQAEA